MAATTIASSATISAMAGANLIKVVTAAPADDGDTVDVSTVCGTTIYSCFVLGATDGLIAATLVSAAGVITIPGATDNEARTCYVLCAGLGGA